MKHLLLAATLAAGALLASTAPASARDGCGPGFHSRPNGRCVPNRGPGYGRPGYGRPGYGHHGYGRPGYDRPVVGNYYRGRGYYHDGRYWRQRYRYHNDWRYR